VIIGSISSDAELNTFSTIDVINGGAGVDTLKLIDDKGAAIALSNLTSVEVVEVTGTKAVNVTATTVADLTDLNIVKTGGAVAATAAATANIKVDVQQATAVAGDSGASVADVKADIAVNGGKNVTVNVTNVKQVLDVVGDGSGELNAINVGQTTAAKGTVTVNSTGVAAANGSNVTLSSINVKGGTTIAVTQKASGDVSGLTANGVTATHTQGAINITATADTTTVNVKQDATIGAQSRAAKAGVDEVATVTFTKLDAGQSVIVGGLTFTAAKDLTAAQVAAAFAGLTDDAIVTTGDTNGGSVRANGVFSGSLAADWTSAAVNGNSVTFTYPGAAATNLAVSGTGVTVVTSTEGVDAVTAQNRLGVNAGAVTIAGAAALATVTVDGFAATGNAITGGSNAALANISLANGASFDVASAAATLGLNLNRVSGTVDIQAGTKTLNAAVTSGTTDTVTLKSASAETVNISGTGSVAGTAGAGALASATSINTSAMTAGKATFTIADGTKTAYTGGAAVDTVTVSNAGTPITKAINLGAGDDKLILSGTVVVPTATLSGGAGTDIIALNGASAATLSTTSAFADKIDGFEKLEITDVVSTATTINMANMDGINYVIANSGATVSAATKATFSVDVAGSSVNATDTITFFAGGTLNVTGNLNATQLALALAGVSYTGWTVKSVSGTVITFESVATGTGIALPTADHAFTLTDDITTPSTLAQPTSGIADGAGAGAAVPALTIDKIANNGTVELAVTGGGVIVKLADASGSADSFNIVTKVAGTDLTFGTVDVAGVETIKYTATDTIPTVSGSASIQAATLNLKADKAATLTIDGNSDVVLTLDTTTNKLATINASALTGSLDFAANGSVAVTVTGGAGDDVLKASVGATAKADVLIGGAGSDTLVAGSNGATLTGGAGNDLFILTAASATGGTKEGNTYSTVTDFTAGDVLKLEYFSNAGNSTNNVSSFTKLTAVLNDSTASFSNFLDAAVTQATIGQAVYFNYKGDTYVVVDSDLESATAFDNGHDLVVKLTGINGDNLSFNSTFGTAALV
jgi:hypothetical protein